jgi:hypothetical protein
LIGLDRIGGSLIFLASIWWAINQEDLVSIALFLLTELFCQSIGSQQDDSATLLKCVSHCLLKLSKAAHIPNVLAKDVADFLLFGVINDCTGSHIRHSR